MGSVYRCHSKSSRRILAAIKVLDGGIARHEEAVARFVREAEVLHRLDHPSVVRVRSVYAKADPPYLEMEFVEGRNLADVLEEDDVDLDRALVYGQQIFDTLAYLHRNQVSHRDIKPENLILTPEGRLKFVDFGLALDQSATRLTMENQTFGTVAYAPPEWMTPEDLEPVSWDLYAAGVLFWEVLTGEIPFPGDGKGTARNQALKIMLLKQTADPLDPGYSFPPSLRVLVRELTHPRPPQRPGSASEVRTRIAQIRGEIGTGWDPDATPAPVQRVRSRPTEKTGTPARDRRRATVPEPPSTLELGVAPFWGPLAVSLLAGLLVFVGIRSVRAPGTHEPILGLPQELKMGVSETESPLVTPARTGVVEMTLDPGLDPALLSLSLSGSNWVRQGSRWTFTGLASGEHTLFWVHGDGCTLERCPGTACPAHCGAGEQRIAVQSAGARTEVDLRVDVPVSTVRLEAPVLGQRKGLFRKKREVIARLDGVVGEREAGAVTFSDTRPGLREVELQVGECEAAERGCWNRSACGDGCLSEVVQVAVPWAAGVVQVSGTLRGR